MKIPVVQSSCRPFFFKPQFEKKLHSEIVSQDQMYDFINALIKVETRQEV